VLRRETGQGLGLEVGERLDRLVTLADSVLECLVLLFEAGDLGVPGIADVTRLPALLNSGLEFFAQLGIGAV
jgi:hypothetical protein